MNRSLMLFATLFATAAVPHAVAAADPGGRPFRDGPGIPEMVVVPAGAIRIGSTEEETTREGRTPAFAAFEHPQRAVRFDRAFAVSRYLVTRAELDRFVRATGRAMAGCTVAVNGKWLDGPQPDYSYRRVGFAQGGSHPAVCVNWSDAVAYARWLSDRTGHRYRLLTEDEWEYAARGGTATARWWGDDPSPAALCARANGGDRSYAQAMPLDKTANMACSDGYAFTSPVKRFAPNPYGLYDMYGNAWQWTADCFAPVPGAAVETAVCTGRSIRGGSWHSSASTLRSATRFSLPPTMRSASLGFRVMREMP